MCGMHREFNRPILTTITTCLQYCGVIFSLAPSFTSLSLFQRMYLESLQVRGPSSSMAVVTLTIRSFGRTSVQMEEAFQKVSIGYCFATR